MAMVDAEAGTFTVKSTAVAALLQLCGEECVWSGNQYEAERLREKNNKAGALHAAKVPGSIAFTFKATGRAMAILKAFDEQRVRLKDGIPVAIEADEWLVATLIASFIDTMNKMNQWWAAVPSTVLNRTGQSCYTIASINASKETLDHLR